MLELQHIRGRLGVDRYCFSFTLRNPHIGLSLTELSAECRWSMTASHRTAYLASFPPFAEACRRISGPRRLLLRVSVIKARYGSLSCVYCTSSCIAPLSPHPCLCPAVGKRLNYLPLDKFLSPCLLTRLAAGTIAGEISCTQSEIQKGQHGCSDGGGEAKAYILAIWLPTDRSIFLVLASNMQLQQFMDLMVKLRVHYCNSNAGRALDSGHRIKSSLVVLLHSGPAVDIPDVANASLSAVLGNKSDVLTVKSGPCRIVSI